MPFTLLLGGARSGKSELSVRLASSFEGPVAVLVTAEARDEEMAERIRRHQERRPADWKVIEVPLELGTAVRELDPGASVVLDCLTLWVANAIEAGLGDDSVVAEARRIAGVLAEREAPAIVVSNEVGLGIVPINALARGYRDTLGRVNAEFADRAERALFVVAGKVLSLEEPSSA